MHRHAAALLLAAQLFACHGDTALDSAVHEPPVPRLAQACGVDGWCWDNPLPGASQINSLWASAWNDVWAGGRDGLLHFDGTAWKVAKLPGGAVQVRSLWGSGKQDVWAAGDSVFHWDGTAWSVAPGLPAADDPTYLSITGAGPKEIWVLVGEGSGPAEAQKILHWNGSAWTTQYGPAGPTLNAIFAAGPGAAWAVGIKLPTLTSQILRLSGATWSPDDVPTGQPLTAVWGSGSSDVWAVGGESAIHWDGKAWTRSPLASSRPLGLRSVAGSGSSDVWAGGNGTVMHWDGRVWSQVFGGNGLDNRATRALFSTGPRNSWAAGEAGLLLHHNGTSWTSYAQGPIEYLDAAHALSATDAWAVGGHGVALHYDGSSWTQTPTPTKEPLYGVWSNTGSDAWAVGASGDCQGFILHWTGAAWSQSYGPVDSTCTGAIWGTGGSDVWAIGNHRVLHWNGADWSETGPTDVASAVWASAPDDVWALQESIQGGPTPPGGVYHFDGTRWTLMSTGSSARLRTLWGTGPRDLWSTTEDPSTAMHWNGSQWSAIPTGIVDQGVSLSSLWGSGPTDLWLGGSGTPILHWDGHTWSAPAGAETRSVSAATGAGGKVWAVGPDGSIWDRTY